MSKFDEFIARFPRELDRHTIEALRAFFEDVEDLSDDYDTLLSRLRATGKFKALFDDFSTTNARKMFWQRRRRERWK